MENYKLKDDEVVLYKGGVKLKNKKESLELILTNKNLVLLNKDNELLSENETTVLEYPVNLIKMYEDMPQIRTKGKTAEIYLKGAEIEVEFTSIMELHKFTSIAKKLLTGESSTQRGAKKVKETIALVDDTLGIDIVQATGDLIKKDIVGGITGAFDKIGKSLLSKKKK